MQNRCVFVFLSFACIAVILVMGCTSSTTQTLSSDNEQHNGAPAIVGTWTASFGGGTCTMVIGADGTVQQWMDKHSELVYSSKWSLNSDGSYSLSKDMIVLGASPLKYRSDSRTIIDNASIVWTNLGTATPGATSTSRAEITSKSSKCQSDGAFYITGEVTSYSPSTITAEIAGDAYDSNKVKLGSDSTYVTIDPNGISKFKLLILDGCPTDGSSGTYSVWIKNLQKSS
jgi:hypothetical protein